MSTQVGFSTTNMIISRIVRWFTNSKCSHAFMVIDLYDKPWVLESGYFGIVLLPLDKFAKANKIVALVPVDVPQINVVSAMEELGDAYDFGGLVGAMFPIVGRWFKARWNNPFNSSRAMFCSEFVVTALQHANFPGSDTLVPANTSPQNLMDFLQGK